MHGQAPAVEGAVVSARDADYVRPCRHPRTIYDEREGTLYCLSCSSWVLDEADRG